jgi:hypothetical protein
MIPASGVLKSPPHVSWQYGKTQPMLTVPESTDLSEKPSLNILLCWKLCNYAKKQAGVDGYRPDDR